MALSVRQVLDKVVHQSAGGTPCSYSISCQDIPEIASRISS
ncbi:MAG: hypothetical protein Q8829_02855 [Candidatus Phytoplasma australasiaticum]|nr:hypothetical protein [Candidatus Phytoplasma australasiaticum]